MRNLNAKNDNKMRLNREIIIFVSRITQENNNMRELTHLLNDVKMVDFNQNDTLYSNLPKL